MGLCGHVVFVCFLTGMVELLESAVEGNVELSILDEKAENLVEVLLSSRKTPPVEVQLSSRNNLRSNNNPKVN